MKIHLHPLRLLVKPVLSVYVLAEAAAFISTVGMALLGGSPLTYLARHFSPLRKMMR